MFAKTKLLKTINLKDDNCQNHLLSNRHSGCEKLQSQVGTFETIASSQK